MAEQESGRDDIGALVREKASRFTAPEGLAARIGDALDAAAREEGRVEAHPASRQVAARRVSYWRPLALAASFLFAIVLSSGTTWYVTAVDRQESLAQAVVSSHIRSMLGEHLTDVASSDQHTVKPWFDGKLDLAPPVVDLTAQGFPLIGGRLDYIDRRPVAALVYRHKQHVINLFVWTGAAPAVAPNPPAELQGYNLSHWRQGDMTFWAVSDVSGADLEKFAAEIRAASN